MQITRQQKRTVTIGGQQQTGVVIGHSDASTLQLQDQSNQQRTIIAAKDVKQTAPASTYFVFDLGNFGNANWRVTII